MIKFDHLEVYNLHNAIVGIRNSWNSQHKSDSTETYLGDEDLKLAIKLNKAGASHAKYLRQVMVSVNITAPLYWWKQFDQYKVGTTTNSESTMHTINRVGFLETGIFTDINNYSKFGINEGMFSLDYNFMEKEMFHEDIQNIFIFLEDLRTTYNETKDKRYWDLLIALLPSGFNQMRTTTLNYAVLANIYHDRKNHKLDEWKTMCEWIKTLPYSELITGVKKDETTSV